MMELKCGTKIKWHEPYSLSIKEGIIVNEMHTYSGRTPDNKYGIRIDSYVVAELDTGSIYDVEKKDIISVMVNGEWIGYSKLSSEYHKSSGRYPWNSVDTKAARDYINPGYKPKKVIFNGPATIVMWQDGTKTIVKRREGEQDDKEKAVMYCVFKKLCGSKAEMDRYLKLFLKEESNDEEKEEAGGSKSDWKKPRAGSGSSEGDL